MSEFEDGFDEFLKAGAAAAPATPEPKTPEATAPAPQVPDKEPTGAAPVAAAATKEPAQPAPVAQQPAAPTLPFPNFDKLPQDTQKAILDRIQHAEQERDRKAQAAAKAEAERVAALGRLGPTQRELEALRRELGAKREAEEKARAKGDPREEARKKQLREQLPDEAELVDAHLGPLTQEMERLRKEREEFAKEREQFRQQAEKQQELAALSEYRPTWQKDLPILGQWIEALDPLDQQYALELASSKKAADNIRLWRMFERDEEIAKMVMAQHQAQPAATETPKPQRQKPALDIDPNPRGRQSPAHPAASALTPEEEGFDRFLQGLG